MSGFRDKALNNYDGSRWQHAWRSNLQMTPQRKEGACKLHAGRIIAIAVLGFVGFCGLLILARIPRTWVYEGAAACVSELPDNQPLPILKQALPASAKNIGYAVCPGNRWHEAWFDLSETDFHSWVADKGWKVRKEKHLHVTTTRVDPRAAVVAEGYEAVSSGTLESRELQTRVVYDPQTQRVYWRSASPY
jgi:hypothetical protein